MEPLVIENKIKTFVYSTPKARANVVIAHGMMEHPGRYLDFIKTLNDQNFNVITFNQLGHGKDATPSLGHWEKGMFRMSVENYHLVIKYTKDRFKNLPTYLFAHSMGSFIAQEFITLYSKEISGLILSGSNGPMIMTTLGSLVTKLFKNYDNKPNQMLNDLMFKPYNNQFKPNRTKFDWLSSNQQEVDKYVSDKLCGFTCTTGFFKEFISSLAKLNQPHKLSKIDSNLPILIISGKEDPVGQFGKGLVKLSRLYLKNNLKNVNLIIYPNARHELLNEFNKEKVKNDVIDWMKNLG